jgi:hypothetical protein
VVPVVTQATPSPPPKPGCDRLISLPSPTSIEANELGLNKNNLDWKFGCLLGRCSHFGRQRCRLDEGYDLPPSRITQYSIHCVYGDMEWAPLILLLHEHSTYIAHRLFIGPKWYNAPFACKYRMKDIRPCRHLKPSQMKHPR